MANPIKKWGYVGKGRAAMRLLKNEILEKVLLRRTKVQQADVLALPPRYTLLVPCCARCLVLFVCFPPVRPPRSLVLVLLCAACVYSLGFQGPLSSYLVHMPFAFLVSESPIWVVLISCALRLSGLQSPFLWIFLVHVPFELFGIPSSLMSVCRLSAGPRQYTPLVWLSQHTLIAHTSKDQHKFGSHRSTAYTKLAFK